VTCNGAKNADTTSGNSNIACHDNLAVLIAPEAIVHAPL
jgi:hypothetical protein